MERITAVYQSESIPEQEKDEQLDLLEKDELEKALEK